MNRNELKGEVSARVFDAVRNDFTDFAHPVEITRISRLEMQIKVLPPNVPPRYFVLKISESV